MSLVHHQDIIDICTFISHQYRGIDILIHMYLYHRNLNYRKMQQQTEQQKLWKNSQHQLSQQNWDIPFTDKSISNAIGVLSNLLKPTARAAANNTAIHPRVSEVEVQRPKVDNNNNDNSRPRRNNNTNNNVKPPRVDINTNNDDQSSTVLQPRVAVHQQKYSQ